MKWAAGALAVSVAVLGLGLWQTSNDLDAVRSDLRRVSRTLDDACASTEDYGDEPCPSIYGLGLRTQSAQKRANDAFLLGDESYSVIDWLTKTLIIRGIIDHFPPGGLARPDVPS